MMHTLNRPIVHKDYLAVYDAATKSCRDYIERTAPKEHPPLLLCFQLGDEPGNIAGVGIIHIGDLHKNEITKDAIVPVIRKLLAGEPLPGNPLPADTYPDTIVYVAEAWTVEVSKEEFDSRVTIAPSMRADRTEALVVGVHIKDHSEIRLCPIVGEGVNRRLKIVPFDEAPSAVRGRVSLDPDA